MESSRQITTKIASPDATIISDSRYLLIAKQLRGHLISAAFLGDSVGRAWPDAAELSHPVSEVPRGHTAEVLPHVCLFGLTDAQIYRKGRQRCPFLSLPMLQVVALRSEEHTSELQSLRHLV